jgi:hypothetical protein
MLYDDWTLCALNPQAQAKFPVAEMIPQGESWDTLELRQKVCQPNVKSGIVIPQTPVSLCARRCLFDFL